MYLSEYSMFAALLLIISANKIGMIQKYREPSRSELTSKYQIKNIKQKQEGNL